jgi:hypothetical protein
MVEEKTKTVLELGDAVLKTGTVRAAAQQEKI